MKGLASSPCLSHEIDLRAHCVRLNTAGNFTAVQPRLGEHSISPEANCNHEGMCSQPLPSACGIALRSIDHHTDSRLELCCTSMVLVMGGSTQLLEQRPMRGLESPFMRTILIECSSCLEFSLMYERLAIFPCFLQTSWAIITLTVQQVPPLIRQAMFRK